MKLLKSTISLGIILSMQALNASVEQGTCAADAGPNKILNITTSNKSVLLDASGSAATPGAGAILSYKWYKGSTYLGSGVTRWYTPTLGFQQLRLVMETASCTDEDIKAVTAINTLHANAGEDLTITITPSNPSVTLDGSASTSGTDTSGIASYEWFDETGTALGTGSTIAVTPPDANATYPVTLTVTDTAGNTDSDTVIVNVTVLNSDQATSLQADAGSDVTLTQTPSHKAIYLNGSNSFGVNGIVSYKWYDGSTYIGPHITRWYVPSSAGVHDIKLVIMDTQGNIDNDDMNLTVVVP